MTLNAFKFGLAGAISAALLWVVCSLLVMVLPATMLSVSGNMLHIQLTGVGWHLTLIGAVKGLFSWSIIAGAAAWLLATIYNRLQSGEIRKKD
jgi:hypothetical protein